MLRRRVVQPQSFRMSIDRILRHWFCEHIRYHIFRRQIFYHDQTFPYFFSDVVMPSFDMPCSMLYTSGCNAIRIFIVTVDGDWQSRRLIKSNQNVSDP